MSKASILAGRNCTGSDTKHDPDCARCRGYLNGWNAAIEEAALLVTTYVSNHVISGLGERVLGLKENHDTEVPND